MSYTGKAGGCFSRCKQTDYELGQQNGLEEPVKRSRSVKDVLQQKSEVSGQGHGENKGGFEDGWSFKLGISMEGYGRRL